jgi:dethiobiotin synthetase
MAAPVLLVGTGTSVGKTYVAERLLRALATAGRRAFGYKPIESGVNGLEPTDAARLAGAASFHVKQEPLRIVFQAPVSPHLAARAQGLTIDASAIHAEIARLRGVVDVLVVELPGGVFSPLTEGLLVAHFARSVPDARVVLVAPDRLGVLHDVGAACRACASVGLPLHGLVLNAPAAPDDSTGRNASELRLVTAVPLLAEIPRGAADAATPESDPAARMAHALIR